MTLRGPSEMTAKGRYFASNNNNISYNMIVHYSQWKYSDSTFYVNLIM